LASLEQAQKLVPVLQQVQPLQLVALK